MDNSTAEEKAALLAVALANAKLTAAQGAAKLAADELNAARKAANELTAAQRAVESSIAWIAWLAADNIDVLVDDIDFHVKFAQRNVERDTARLAAAQQAAAKFDTVEVLRARDDARRSEVWLAHDEARTALRAGATAFPHAFPHAFPPVTARLSSGDNPAGHSVAMNCLTMSGFH